MSDPRASAPPAPGRPASVPWQLQPTPEAWRPPEPEPAPPPSGMPVASTIPARARERDPFVGGLVLIALGLLLLAGESGWQLLRFLPLAVGIGLLALFVRRRVYGLLVAGCIVTGVGVGVALAVELLGPHAGSAVLLCLGVGFGAIWPLALLFGLPQRSPWPLVPGAVLFGIGLLQVLGPAGLDVGDLWPSILVIIGLVILARGVWGRGHGWS